ncbi:GNAT family N-acetyltransferase [Sinosporangium siamense]|uniref:N-acetyltransferase domain-containing protein n=1 Tax=Sinosporangium siamense TaxID=1367973 RepID=A0A919RJK6_9ACTN|nr:GNAT family N-acetyltransferase [Sinosporangium siamense]GII94010.1 hypothetical protein Ssi02_42410 [Sinosporangium siamense]
MPAPNAGRPEPIRCDRYAPPLPGVLPLRADPLQGPGARAFPGMPRTMCDRSGGACDGGTAVADLRTLAKRLRAQPVTLTVPLPQSGSRTVTYTESHPAGLLQNAANSQAGRGPARCAVHRCGNTAECRYAVLGRPVIRTGALASAAQPVLQVADGVLLRPWRSADAPAVKAAFEDPEIQRRHVRRTDSVAEAREWVEGWRDTWRQETAAHWALTDDTTLLGRAALKSLSLDDGVADGRHDAHLHARTRRDG